MWFIVIVSIIPGNNSELLRFHAKNIFMKKINIHSVAFLKKIHSEIFCKLSFDILSFNSYERLVRENNSFIFFCYLYVSKLIDLENKKNTNVSCLSVVCMAFTEKSLNHN